jgi:hypothetical protein
MTVDVTSGIQVSMKMAVAAEVVLTCLNSNVLRFGYQVFVERGKCQETRRT